MILKIMFLLKTWRMHKISIKFSKYVLFYLFIDKNNYNIIKIEKIFYYRLEARPHLLVKHCDF